jgi:hypothetical protein
MELFSSGEDRASDRWGSRGCGEVSWDDYSVEVRLYGRFYVRYSTLLHLPPLRFHCVEDAGIETRTVATLALTARRSNN